VAEAAIAALMLAAIRQYWVRVLCFTHPPLKRIAKLFWL